MPEPYGVMGIACPTDAPLLGFLSPRPARDRDGQPVVAVPSQNMPLAATDLYQVLETSDVPGGVVNIVTGAREELVKTLAEHDDVAAMWYCGSADGAKAVEGMSAGNLKVTWTPAEPRLAERRRAGPRIPAARDAGEEHLGAVRRMTDYLFPPPAVRSIPVVGETAEYPVHRIFCVGRNYADHAKEMGSTIDRSAPFYFTKSLTALAASPARMPYPPGTADYHHEVELVVALGAPLFNADASATSAAILGYAVGLDMTRRDLQAASKEKRQPWDTGKDVEGSAIVGAITRRADAGDLQGKAIRLSLDGQDRQVGRLSDMVWSVDEILAHLSGLYHLGAGDLIFTGTPAGVGPVLPGQQDRGQDRRLARGRIGA